MAGKPQDIDTVELLRLAEAYCDHCIASTKEVATPKGPVSVKERHLPTVSYFLSHWLRQKHFDFYTRGNWYVAMKNADHPCFDTIKRIDSMFNALATDIVANEGKGIFYAKNKLGMTDRVETKNENDNKHSGAVSVTVTTVTSGVPLANRETDVDAER